MILFQICNIKCNGSVLFGKENLSSYRDPDLLPILKWTGLDEHTVIDTLDDRSEIRLPSKKDIAYVEDKLIVGLLLLAGSHKVCTEINSDNLSIDKHGSDYLDLPGVSMYTEDSLSLLKGS